MSQLEYSTRHLIDVTCRALDLLSRRVERSTTAAELGDVVGELERALDLNPDVDPIIRQALAGFLERARTDYDAAAAFVIDASELLAE